MHNSRQKSANNTGGEEKIETLRILFDAHWLAAGPPSGRSVVRGLIKGWKHVYPSDSLTLKVPAGVPHSHLQAQLGFDDFGVDSAGPPIANHGIRTIATLPSKRYDVFFSQNFGAVMSGALQCAFVHDALYIDHPDWFSKAERAYLSLLRPSLARTDIIFTSSYAEARRLQRVWPKLTNRIRPIGLGLPSWVDNPSISPSFKTESSRPYILTVGRLNIRKNLRKLIAAYQGSSARNTHDLIIVGEPNGLPDDLTGQQESVIVAGGVTDAQLKRLYENAAAFVFPSLDEGFGLPLIEAHRFGLPICASDIPPFRELDIADIYFNPHSETQISEALGEVVQQPRKAKGTSEMFPWSAVVKKARAEVTTELSKRSL